MAGKKGVAGSQHCGVYATTGADLPTAQVRVRVNGKDSDTGTRSIEQPREGCQTIPCIRLKFILLKGTLYQDNRADMEVII